MIQSQRWCPDCETYTVHVKEMWSYGEVAISLGCLYLSLVVVPGLGLFSLLLTLYFPLLFPLLLAAWLSLLVLGHHLAPWRCQVCGATGSPAHERLPQPLPRKPPAPLKVPLPRLDWSAVLATIQRSPLVIDRHIRIAWSRVEAAYSRLPEWAQPIIWGFGLSIPVAIVAIGIWTVMRL